MPIRAILFDLDDTLIVDEAVSVAAFAAVAEKANLAVGVELKAFQRAAREHAKRLHAASSVYPYCKRIGISAFECLWGRFEGETADLTALRNWALDYRRQVFRSALRSLEVEADETADELAAAFEAQRRQLQRLMPDAREVLVRLSQDYRIGLLTNGAPDLQREKLTASGLQPHFHAIAISGEHDIGKPNPEIFHRLLAELGAAPGEAVMVGNSLERDIAGARAAGIPSVWLRVAGSEEPADVVPDHEITALAQLASLLPEIDRETVNA